MAGWKNRNPRSATKPAGNPGKLCRGSSKSALRDLGLIPRRVSVARFEHSFHISVLVCDSQETEDEEEDENENDLPIHFRQLEGFQNNIKRSPIHSVFIKSLVRRAGQ